MKVLYISYDGMTDPLGQSQVLPYIVSLSGKDVKIVLMSFEKADRYKSSGRTIQDLISKAGIEWVPVTYAINPPVLSKVWNVVRMWHTAKNLYKKHSIEMVHCRSYIPALVGLRLKKKYGLKFIFDMRGFWADERVDGKIWNLNNPLFRIIYHYLKRKEKEFLEKADYTVALTYASRDEIHSWNEIPGQPIPIEVIPCCADLKLFNRDALDAEVVKKLRTKLALNQDDFIIIYSGSIGTWYMLDEMLDFFKRLLLKKPGSRFLIVTLDDAEMIYEHSRKKGIPDSHIKITPAKREEMPVYLRMADVALFFIMPVFSKKASSPTKQGEIMGMGIPAICNQGVGDTDMVIEKYKAGFIVKEFSDKEYDRVINELNNLDKFTPTDITKGAQEFYSLEVGVSRYGKVYSKVAEN